MKSQINMTGSAKLSTFNQFQNTCDEHGIIFTDKDIDVLRDRFSLYGDEYQSNLMSAIRKRAELNNKRQKHIEEILSESCNVPKRYMAAKKEDLSAEVLKEIDAFTTGRIEGLFLPGGPGIGKTHLAVSLMRESILSAERDITFQAPDRFYVKQYLRPYFQAIPDLLSEIRNTFDDDNDLSEKQLMEKYTGEGKDQNHSFLVLDDLGSEKKTDWSEQTIYTLIDHRYRNLKRTIITSNFSLNEISKKYNDRSASRITEICEVVTLKGI